MLAALALEMWTSGTEHLPADVFAFVSEVFADAKKKNKVISNQIIERIKQHALIVGTGTGRFGFDHPEFYHFFLGESIGRMLVERDAPGLRLSFRQGVIPPLAVDTAARFAARGNTDLLQIIGLANQLLVDEPRMSLVKENLSGIVIVLLQIATSGRRTISGGTFPPDSLRAFGNNDGLA